MMRASIAHRIRGRCRFVYEDNLKKENLNKLKYCIEEVSGVKSCKTSLLTNSITVSYNEVCVSKLAKSILNLDMDIIENTSIDNVDFQTQSENDLFNILGNTMYRRIFFKYMLPVPIGTVALFLRAHPFIENGVKSLLNRKLNVELLGATTISVSLATRQFADAANIMFLLGLGEKIEDYATKEPQGNSAHSLVLNIDNVFVIENDEKIIKNIEDVEIGDIAEVEIGNSTPVDRKVIKDVTMVNKSLFIGESNPVKKTSGSVVLAGAAIEEGSTLIGTAKKHDDSRLSYIISLISESEKNKLFAQKKAESMADSLAKYSFIGAALTYSFIRDLQKAESFLIADFSCVLKLIIPITVMEAISQASEEKILVRDGKYLENLFEADTVVFDKTGTLTKSKPRVAKAIAPDKISEDERLRIAACFEEHFPHSIAKAVVEHAKFENLKHKEMHSKPEYIVAHGIRTKIVDKDALIESEHFILDDEGTKINDETKQIVDKLKEDYSLLYLVFTGRLIAVICIEDPLRDEACDIVKSLRDLSFINITMLTGDTENSAHSVASQLDLDYYQSQALPEDKQSYILQEKEKDNKVVMIGDDISDSVVLSSADVGISMHQGAGIAKEISGISIGSDSLEGLVDVVKLPKAMEKRIDSDHRQVVGSNSTLIILGVMGILANTLPAFPHNLSTVMIADRNINKYKI